MNSSVKYSVLLITNAEQLTEALSLRYRTYKKAYPNYNENSTHPYESDAFDSRSVHLGLYCENGIVKKLAGYCRLVLPQFFEKEFSNLFISHPEYIHGIQRAAKERLALMERMPQTDGEAVNLFCNSLEAEKIMYAEASRFIIDEDHRSISLSSFFLSSMMAVCESLQISYSFFTCNHHHVSFYKRFGLTLFPGISPFDNKDFGRQYVIFGTDLKVANAQLSTIKTLRLQLEEEKRITFKKAA